MQFSWHLTTEVNHKLMNFKLGVSFSSKSAEILLSFIMRVLSKNKMLPGLLLDLAFLCFNVSGITCTTIFLTKSKSDFQNLTHNLNFGRRWEEAHYRQDKSV